MTLTEIGINTADVQEKLVRLKEKLRSDHITIMNDLHEFVGKLAQEAATSFDARIAALDAIIGADAKPGAE